ncbi:hypothetical protein GGX14DRAFT_697600 [Mycena pura]|uniref:Uncharacterized protein n=1 Tax=Mycena pura TaxID=153505 RepID=A0AAD6VHZ8_9AGAR|nr:hypothetical protein GGX14DRAFT_697600 [Mycena pura]
MSGGHYSVPLLRAHTRSTRIALAAARVALLQARAAPRNRRSSSEHGGTSDTALASPKTRHQLTMRHVRMKSPTHDRCMCPRGRSSGPPAHKTRRRLPSTHHPIVARQRARYPPVSCAQDPDCRRLPARHTYLLPVARLLRTRPAACCSPLAVRRPPPTTRHSPYCRYPLAAHYTPSDRRSPTCWLPTRLPCTRPTAYPRLLPPPASRPLHVVRPPPATRTCCRRLRRSRPAAHCSPPPTTRRPTAARCPLPAPCLTGPDLGSVCTSVVLFT